MNTAIIQIDPANPLLEHCNAAWQGLEWLNYHVVPFDPSSKKVILDPKIPIIASCEATLEIFKQNGYVPPVPLNVPEELIPFAGRTIQRATLLDFRLNNKSPVFIKPADTVKLFAVVETKLSKTFFNEFPNETPILVSDVVDIVSEYRVFVGWRREIEGIRHYSGDPFITPNKQWIMAMIQAYKTAPIAYGLDVGVLSSGETVIIECNDFWALGTYGWDPVAYSRLLIQRWHELVTQLQVKTH